MAPFKNANEIRDWLWEYRPGTVFLILLFICTPFQIWAWYYIINSVSDLILFIIGTVMLCIIGCLTLMGLAVSFAWWTEKDHG